MEEAEKAKEELEKAKKEESLLRFADDVVAMAESDDLTDFTLICQGVRFRGHKVILAARSSVIRKAVTTDMSEKNKDELEIRDSTPEAVKAMLYHINTGGVPDNISDIVDKLLHLSVVYDLQSLKMACEKTLLDDLTTTNAINTLILADRQGDLTRKLTNIQWEIFWKNIFP